MKTVKQVRGITPILQHLLIKQIGRILDAMNMNDYLGAWLGLRALVLVSPPKVKEDSIKELKAIEKQIDQIMAEHNIDIAYEQANQIQAIGNLMRQKVVPLLEKVMAKLYEGEYLEDYREFAMGRELNY